MRTRNFPLIIVASFLLFGYSSATSQTESISKEEAKNIRKLDRIKDRYDRFKDIRNILVQGKKERNYVKQTITNNSQNNILFTIESKSEGRNFESTANIKFRIAWLYLSNKKKYGPDSTIRFLAYDKENGKQKDVLRHTIDVSDYTLETKNMGNQIFYLEAAKAGFLSFQKLVKLFSKEKIEYQIDNDVYQITEEENSLIHKYFKYVRFVAKNNFPAKSKK